MMSFLIIHLLLSINANAQTTADLPATQPTSEFETTIFSIDSTHDFHPECNNVSIGLPAPTLPPQPGYKETSFDHWGGVGVAFTNAWYVGEDLIYESPLSDLVWKSWSSIQNGDFHKPFMRVSGTDHCYVNAQNAYLINFDNRTQWKRIGIKWGAGAGDVLNFTVYAFDFASLQAHMYTANSATCSHTPIGPCDPVCPNTCAPTLSPTLNPTNFPTTDPTTDPTNDPTIHPTYDPTADPTFDPTVDPTIDPTVDPTIDPTNDPTNDPTIDPTVDPTSDPTNDPTNDPTIDPTVDPTVDPTSDPTFDPTVDPTSDPTVDPTSDPTNDPTNDPTIDPTVDPTRDPTNDPTNDPTVDPTRNPTDSSDSDDFSDMEDSSDDTEVSGIYDSYDDSGSAEAALLVKSNVDDKWLNHNLDDTNPNYNVTIDVNKFAMLNVSFMVIILCIVNGLWLYSLRSTQLQSTNQHE